MKDKWRRNLRLMHYVRALQMFLIAMPIIVIFFQDLGLSFLEILILQGIFSVTAAVCEAPSGYFADTYGRRLSVIVGMWLAVAAWIIYSVSYSFWQLAVAELVLGLGFSFKSGIIEAIIHDSLAALDETEDNLANNSKTQATGYFSEGVAGILGGFIAVLSLRIPLVLQIAVALIALPVGYAITEPPVEKTATKRLQEVFSDTLIKRQDLRWLVLLSSLIGTMTYTVVWFMQPYYEQAGIWLGLFGVIWFIKHSILALFSNYVALFREKFGTHALLLSFPIVGSLTYLAISQGVTVWLLPAFIGFEYVRGVSRPLLNDMLQQRIDSDYRASVDSINNLSTRLFFTVFGTAAGWIADAYGMQKLFLISAVFYGPVIWLVLRRITNHNILSFEGR